MNETTQTEWMKEEATKVQAPVGLEMPAREVETPSPRVYLCDGGIEVRGETMGDALGQLLAAQDQPEVKVFLAWTRISARNEWACKVAA